MEDSRALQLQLIDEISSLFSHEQIPHWLFGGWSVDFHGGAVTREHGDVEFFIWEHDGPRAGEVLDTARYQPVDHPHPDEASIWRKEGQIVELYFLAVTAQGDVVGRGQWDHWPPTPESHHVRRTGTTWWHCGAPRTPHSVTVRPGAGSPVSGEGRVTGACRTTGLIQVEPTDGAQVHDSRDLRR